MNETGRIRKIVRDNQKIIHFLLPLLILALIFPSVISGERVFIGDYHDVLANSMPYTFLGDHLFSQWNNAWIGGFPEYASPMSDRYYPFSLPFYLATKDIFILNFVILLHVYIAFFTFYKLSGLFCKNNNLILISSLFYSFSGIMLSRVWAGHIFIVYALAWIPLVYYYFFRITLFQGSNGKNTVLFALCSVLLLFTGAVYYFFYTFLILGVYILYAAWTKMLPRKMVIALAIAISLVFLVASIKVVPDLNIFPYTTRIDPINPLDGGGSLENNLAAFITGTPIDTVLGWHESRALIGVIPILFIILALIFGERNFTFPSFFAILFAFLWADGGKTVLSFLHLLPLLNTLRCPGRIFGSLLPILLILGLQGVQIASSRLTGNQGFTTNGLQKRSIALGALCFAGLKLTELPFQAIPGWQAILSFSLVAVLIGIIYSDRLTEKILYPFFCAALLLNLGALALDYPLLDSVLLVKAMAIAGIVSAAVILSMKGVMRVPGIFLCSILLIGLFTVTAANISYVRTFDPKLEESQALPVLDAMARHPSPNIQPWVLENGWPIQHIDFTYWLIKNGSHPVRAYYAYFLATIPFTAYELGNTTYYTPDYIIDTTYLENGRKNLPNSSFEVSNISVVQPEHVLPNAFVVRGESVIRGRITRFTPDEVILEGDFRKGDIAALKAAFYPGWRINGIEAVSFGNMPGTQLTEDTEEIRYEFAPLDLLLGIILSGAGIISMAIILGKRKDIDRYLAPDTVKEGVKSRKRKR
jgi:hypothetical protein